MSRSEQDKLSMAPIEAKLGEKTYQIKPLRIGKELEWRKKVQENLGPVIDQLQITKVANSTLVTGLPSTIAPFADKVLELLFLYAPDLPKDEVMDEDKGATSEQIALVFSQIWDLVFQDFLSLLAKAAPMLKKETASTQPGATARSLN